MDKFLARHNMVTPKAPKVPKAPKAPRKRLPVAMDDEAEECNDPETDGEQEEARKTPILDADEHAAREWHEKNAGSSIKATMMFIDPHRAYSFVTLE